MPAGLLEPTSKGSAPLSRMVLDGKLRAALIHLPVDEPELYVQTVCSEKMMLCMRADDPLSKEEKIPGLPLKNICALRSHANSIPPFMTPPNGSLQRHTSDCVLAN